MTLRVMASLAVLAACQTPQPPPVADSPSECARLAAAAGTQNSKALFEAIGVCVEEEQKEEANYLLMVAQIRAMADIGALTPADERDPVLIELAGLIYSGMGGLGYDEVYRDPAAVDRLAGRVEATQIGFTSGYDPGWAYKPDSKIDIYDAIAAAARQQRIWQMRNFALLMQNDAYYEAHLAHSELMRQHDVFAEGTPEYEESLRLSALKSEAAASVVQLPPPQIELPYARLNEPDPDAQFRQIATGFNGPDEYGVDIFVSAADAEASWLAQAYPADQLDSLLAGVDFDREVLAAYKVGQRVNASGAVIIRELEYDARFDGYSISIRVGVAEAPCEGRPVESYPFALATVGRGETTDVNSTSLSNFPDTCIPN